MSMRFRPSLTLTDKDFGEVIWVPSLLYKLIDSVLDTQIRSELLTNLAEHSVCLFGRGGRLSFDPPAPLRSLELFRVGGPDLSAMFLCVHKTGS